MLFATECTLAAAVFCRCSRLGKVTCSLSNALYTANHSVSLVDAKLSRSDKLPLFLFIDQTALYVGNFSAHSLMQINKYFRKSEDQSQLQFLPKSIAPRFGSCDSFIYLVSSNMTLYLFEPRQSLQCVQNFLFCIHHQLWVLSINDAKM